MGNIAEYNRQKCRAYYRKVHGGLKRDPRPVVYFPAKWYVFGHSEGELFYCNTLPAFSKHSGLNAKQVWYMAEVGKVTCGWRHLYTLRRKQPYGKGKVAEYDRI